MSTIDLVANEAIGYSNTQAKEVSAAKNENDIENSDNTSKAAAYTPPKDVVEISDEGRQALNASLITDTESSSTDENQTKEVSTTEMYTMSEYQLSQKLNDGSISQSQYNNEMARRSNDTEI